MAVANGSRILSGLMRHLLRNGVASQFRTYKAVQVNVFDEVPVITDIETKPKASNHHVLVNVEAAGFNHADLMMIKGRGHRKLTLPFTPGFEFSGEVLEVGEAVTKFNKGDRVLGLKTHGIGAFAELCVADEDELYPIPYSMSYEMAASLPVGYGTALHIFQDIVKCKEGNYVLIITSQGSSGIAAMDIALNVFKCKVIVASNNEQKLSDVRPSGVLATIDLMGENLEKILDHSCKKNGGVDVIIDTVGGEYVKEALKSLKHGGHICSLGFSSGQVPDINLMDLVAKRATVSGIWLGGLARSNPSKFHDLITEVIRLHDDKFITPLKAHQVSLENFESAMQFSEKTKGLGKVVLTMR